MILTAIFKDLSAIVGSVWLILMIWKLSWFVYSYFIRPNLLMPKNRQAFEYNKKGGAWAVVTGGSDGIGLAFCMNLAAQGFNICIISRNENKINEKLALITSKYPIKTLCIKADFSKILTIQEYHDLIGSKLKSLDVAILVLNAGIAITGSTLLIKDQSIQEMCNINVLHVMYMTKIMTP